jgi:hypothetical protein
MEVGEGIRPRSHIEDVPDRSFSPTPAPTCNPTTNRFLHEFVVALPFSLGVGLAAIYPRLTIMEEVGIVVALPSRPGRHAHALVGSLVGHGAIAWTENTRRAKGGDIRPLVATATSSQPTIMGERASVSTPTLRMQQHARFERGKRDQVAATDQRVHRRPQRYVPGEFPPFAPRWNQR